MDEYDLDKVKYDHLRIYAEFISDELMEMLPSDAVEDNESLSFWVSSNEMNYNPEDVTDTETAFI